MTGPTHILFGAATGIVVARTGILAIDAVSLVCLLVGSLMPDIDADGGSISRPGKIFKGFLPWRTARYFDELGAVVSRIARSISGHRGFFHTPMLALLIGIAAWYWESARLSWFVIGYLSHIGADACTKHGVPLFWPISAGNVSLSEIRTGSLLEGCLAAMLTVFVLYAGYDLLPENTRKGLNQIGQSFLH